MQKRIGKYLEHYLDINTHEILRENLFKDFPIFKNFNEIPQLTYENLEIKNINGSNNNIKINEIDFYFSNIIAASSKTMNECKIAKQILLKTGTDN
ncbi:MAG: hypothetical protein RL765_824 [Pseudomonadota bacterium]